MLGFSEATAQQHSNPRTLDLPLHLCYLSCCSDVIMELRQLWIHVLEITSCLLGVRQPENTVTHAGQNLGAAAEKANGSMLRGNSDTTTPTACIMTPTDHDTPMKPRTRLGSRERTSAHVVNGKTTQELRDELNKLRHARRSTQSQNTIKKKEVVTRKTHSSKLVARSSSGERQNRVSGDGRQVSCSGKPCVDSCPKLR